MIRLMMMVAIRPSSANAMPKAAAYCAMSKGLPPRLCAESAPVTAPSNADPKTSPNQSSPCLPVGVCDQLLLILRDRVAIS